MQSTIAQASFSPLSPIPLVPHLVLSFRGTYCCVSVKSAIVLTRGWNVTSITRHIMCAHVVEDISNWLYIYLLYHHSFWTIASEKTVWIISYCFRDSCCLLMNTLQSFIFQMCNLLVAFSMHFCIPEDPLLTEIFNHYSSLVESITSW